MEFQNGKKLIKMEVRLKFVNIDVYFRYTIIHNILFS